MTTDLDSFEAELLGELRTVVSSRSHERFASEPLPVRRRWRRAAAVAATGVGAVVAATFLPGPTGSTAFAVQEGPSGTIEVQVTRLEDAADLEAALGKYGVKADVKYLGRSQKCAPGRYLTARSGGGRSTSLTLGEQVTVTLDPRDVAHAETLVLAVSRIPNGYYGEFGLADGPVGACDPVPIPARDLPDAQP